MHRWVFVVSYSVKPNSHLQDNAAMIAWAAHYKLAKEELADPATLMPRSKWSLEDL